MLDRMGNELTTLRKLLKSREEKMANAGMSVESHADVLDRQFWAAVPDSGKRTGVACPRKRGAFRRATCSSTSKSCSDAANRMPPETFCCNTHLAFGNKDAEARKKAAIGLGQLAELYSKAASQRLQDALAQIGQQMAAEKETPNCKRFSAPLSSASARNPPRAVTIARCSRRSIHSPTWKSSRPSWVQSLASAHRRG